VQHKLIIRFYLNRENLVDQLQNMLDFETADRSGMISFSLPLGKTIDIHSSSLPLGSRYIPPNRLLTLLRQSVAYQIEFSRYHPKIAPTVNTLLEDYTSFVIPNAVGATLTGHKGNVKCVEFIGEEGRTAVSGSR
jgi:hypothetical protein